VEHFTVSCGFWCGSRGRSRRGVERSWGRASGCTHENSLLPMLWTVVAIALGVGARPRTTRTRGAMELSRGARPLPNGNRGPRSDLLSGVAGATARVDAVGMPRCCRGRHVPDPRNIFSRGVLSGGSGPGLLEVKRNVFHSAWVNGSHGYQVLIRCPARLITPDEKHSPTRARHEPPPNSLGFLATPISPVTSRFSADRNSGSG